MLPSGWGAKSLAAGWPNEDYSDFICCQEKKVWKPAIHAVFARFCKLASSLFSPLHATPDLLKTRKNGTLLLHQSHAAASRFAKIFFRFTSLPPLQASARFSLLTAVYLLEKRPPDLEIRRSASKCAHAANSPCHTAAISAGSQDCCRKRSRWRSWFRLSSEESTP